LVSEHFPSFSILKRQTFKKLNLLPSSGEKGRSIHPVG
jgi:hypothetical protein